MKRISSIALAVALLAVVGSTVLSYRAVKDFFANEPVASKFEEALLRLARPINDVIAPPPLRSSRDVPDSRLTAEGVIHQTNTERANAGLRTLRENALLARSAQAKVDDMFRYQYFEHVSPLGKGPGDLAEDAGYAYVVVGENLALGNFADDADLVAAWMDSPGHRANILNSRYQEIGVAVKRGIFEGRTTWLAVQEFGMPVSACPTIEKTLASAVEQKKQELEGLRQTLDALSSEIETLKARQQEVYQKGQALLDEGNRLVAEGNAKIREGNRIYKETGSREAAEPYWQEGKRLQEEGEVKIKEGLALNEELKVLKTQVFDKVSAYNALISRINALVEETKAFVERYNAEVQAFNACAQG